LRKQTKYSLNICFSERKTVGGPVDFWRSEPELT